MLVDILSRHCDDDSFAAFCESLTEVGQQQVVDKYFRSTQTGNLQAPGIPDHVLNTCMLLRAHLLTVAARC